jgi:hypothetical protein
MKVTEQVLRAPLPDQLKALLEKFDLEFDARSQKSASKT